MIDYKKIRIIKSFELLNLNSFFMKMLSNFNIFILSLYVLAEVVDSYDGDRFMTWLCSYKDLFNVIGLHDGKVSLFERLPTSLDFCFLFLSCSCMKQDVAEDRIINHHIERIPGVLSVSQSYSLAGILVIVTD